MKYWVAFLFAFIVGVNSSEAQWTRTSGLTNASVVSMSASGTKLYVGSDQGLSLTTDGGGSWSSIITPAAQIFSVGYNDTSLLVGGSDALYRSKDGSSWSVIRASAPGHPFRSIALNSPHVFFTVYDSLYWSDDDGQHFNLVDSQLDAPVSSQVGNEILIVVDNVVAEVMGTADGIYYLHFGDGYAKQALSSVHVTALTADYEQCFAATTSGFYTSSDWGQTWFPTNGPPGTTTALAAVNSMLVAGTSDGHVYYSDETAQNWTNSSQGLPSTGITSFAVVGQTLYAGTQSNGVWRRAISEVFGGQDAVSESLMPQSQLHIYPNPILRSTLISFRPPSSGYADVTIVNPLGTEVAKIFSGELSQGEQHFNWEPTALPNGMYECLLRQNGHVEKMPVIIQK